MGAAEDYAFHAVEEYYIHWDSGHKIFIDIYGMMVGIRRPLNFGFDEILDRLHSGPKESDNFIGCPMAFEELQTYMKIDGSTEQICIE